MFEISMNPEFSIVAIVMSQWLFVVYTATLISVHEIILQKPEMGQLALQAVDPAIEPRQGPPQAQS